MQYYARFGNHVNEEEEGEKKLRRMKKKEDENETLSA